MSNVHYPIKTIDFGMIDTAKSIAQKQSSKDNLLTRLSRQYYYMKRHVSLYWVIIDLVVFINLFSILNLETILRNI